MKHVILAVFVAAAFAAPQSTRYEAPAASSTRADSGERVAILRDERIMEEDGRFNVEFEAENGIHFAKAGSPDAANGAVIQAGQYSYTAPDGTPVLVKFVANENGFQPESNLLPVAPEFPHPIPQFVLDQIAFAAEEDARRAREGSFETRDSIRTPSRTYGSPQ
ncbi:cuticle protein AMP1A-like [Macrobrachium nipponense]|uniref:cuticle protein AMP1A-like n=1 Tax=Macrobrachium nipponense TaxID=159736 RepID=UPI0030C86316